MGTAAESDNVRLVRRMYVAWDALDLDTVFGLLHPEVQWINPAYAVENVEAHWVVVAAWVLLAVALWRILSTASRRGAGAGRSGP